MSEDRMRELGIPRRRFLKRGAAAAFVAPAVVSFALDGVAEADPGSMGNQAFCNQAFSNQVFLIEQDLTQVITVMLIALECQGLNAGQASGVARQALTAALAVASNASNACGQIQALINTINSLPNSGAKQEALFLAQDAQVQAGCPIT